MPNKTNNWQHIFFPIYPVHSSTFTENSNAYVQPFSFLNLFNSLYPRPLSHPSCRCCLGFKSVHISDKNFSDIPWKVDIYMDGHPSNTDLLLQYCQFTAVSLFTYSFLSRDKYDLAGETYLNIIWIMGNFLDDTISRDYD